jgi:trimethylamine--corrinoid protein Co-methyltransferase
MKPCLLTVLSEEEIVKIDGESRCILERSGVKVRHSQALELLEDVGCDVDRSSSMVRITGPVLDRAVEAARGSFSLYGRDSSESILLGEEKVVFGPGGFAVFVEDIGTGKRRIANREDLRDHLRLSDYLPGCAFNHVNVFPSDLPEKTADLHIWADALVYQTKPIMNENYGSHSVEVLLEMAGVVSGSRRAALDEPRICLDACVLSPLTHDTRQVELLLAGSTYGIPISVNSGPIAGGTSPVTLAAVVSQANAELLSALVIAFAGAEAQGRSMPPLLYGSWGRHMDMRYGTVTMGGPEFALLKVCTAQMGRFYDLPTRGGGALTDSLATDAQSGYEKMLTTLVPALAGLNYISGMGLNESENQQSLAQLVIDDEIVGMVQRLLDGVRVDDAHLATELIMDTGPDGNFLDTDHTLRFFKEELFDPEISSRMKYERWEGGGSRSVHARALERAEHILRDHHPEEELDAKAVREIYRIVEHEDRRSNG